MTERVQVQITGLKEGSTFESLLKAVGFTVIQWGACEQALELVVATLFQSYGGSGLSGRSKLPKGLQDELAFVSECADKLPHLAAYKSDVQVIVSDFTAVKSVRDGLVHGAMSSPKHVDGVYNFIRLQRLKHIHEVEYFDFDLKTFPITEAKLYSLNSKLLSLNRRLQAGLLRERNARTE